MTAQDAAELLERFEADREMVAWEIVHRFTPYLKRQVSKYVHDFDDTLAEAQIFFHDNLLRWDASRGTPFGAFVYTAAKFSVRSAANKMKRQWKRKSLDNPYPEFEDSGEELLGGVDNNIEEHAFVRWTSDLLDTLPPRNREIVAMRFGLEGHSPLTVKEIAEHFGISGARIRSIIKLSLADLSWVVRDEL